MTESSLWALLANECERVELAYDVMDVEWTGDVVDVAENTEVSE